MLSETERAYGPLEPPGVSSCSPKGARQDQEAAAIDTPSSCQRGQRYRLSWAQALAKVFDVDVINCPRCKQKGLQHLAVITDAQVLRGMVAAIERKGEPL